MSRSEQTDAVRSVLAGHVPGSRLDEVTTRVVDAIDAERRNRPTRRHIARAVGCTALTLAAAGLVTGVVWVIVAAWTWIASVL